MKKVKVITQCKPADFKSDPYWHPFKLNELVNIKYLKDKDSHDRYIGCSNGKEFSYLTEYDVEEIPSK